MGVDKVVLVTGATGGIGGAVAEEFARQGIANIIAVGRRKEALAELRERLTPYGAQVRTIEAELRSNTDINRIVRNVNMHYDRLDVLANIAGTFDPISYHTEDMPEETLLRLFEAIDEADGVLAGTPKKLYLGLLPAMLRADDPKGLDMLSQINGKYFDGNLNYAGPKEDHRRTSLDVAAATKGRVRTHRIYPGLVNTRSTTEFDSAKLSPEYVAEQAVKAVLYNGATDIAMKMTEVEGAVKRQFYINYGMYVGKTGVGERTFDGDAMLQDYLQHAMFVFPMVFMKE